MFWMFQMSNNLNNDISGLPGSGPFLKPETRQNDDYFPLTRRKCKWDKFECTSGACFSVNKVTFCSMKNLG